MITRRLHIMKFTLVSLFFLSLYQLNAQLGINARYGNINPVEWESISQEGQLFNSHLELGVDYWFRLKNFRVEFTPEIFGGRSSTSNNAWSYQFTNLGIQANTNFYIMDFEGDCDCPTFSKDGNFFSKGFHISIAPIAEYQAKSLENVEVSLDEYRSINFGATLGAGIDIGITDLVTVTPYIRYKFVPNSKWEGFASIHHQADNPGSFIDFSDNEQLLRYPQFGIRLGFRPDYVRQQNKYRFRR